MDFTIEIMPFINTAVTLIVGLGLGLIIKHKNSLIKTLTSQFDSTQKMLDLYDVHKYKEHQQLSEEILNMKHQKTISDTEVATLMGIEKGAESFAIK